MAQLRKKLTYANVVSTLSLLVAVSGASAFAAGQLASRSVGARQLRPSSVTADKIRKNAVTAPKIKALAVKNGKLANGAVDAAKLASGSVGSSELANSAVTSEKIGVDAVTGVNVEESTLGQVPSASRADAATFAESADPVAFAAIDQEGNVDPSLSKGIDPSDVVVGGESGVYCITVPGLRPRGAQVTPEYSGSGQIRAFATVKGAPECAVPGVEVRTWSNVSMTKSPFYITLYR